MIRYVYQTPVGKLYSEPEKYPGEEAVRAAINSIAQSVMGQWLERLEQSGPDGWTVL